MRAVGFTPKRLKMSAADAPILIFDSGIGGLSVLRATQRLLPQAPIVYAADYAAMPYGQKSEVEIAGRVPAILGRLSERYQPSLICIACNTASTIALPAVRAALEVPIVGTVPAIKPAALQSRSRVIGLLGTAATIRQPYVDLLANQFASDARLLRFGAPDLVHAAEVRLSGGNPDPAIFDAAINGLLYQDGQDMDMIVLACTHFPLVQDDLAAAAVRAGLTPQLGFVDGSGGIARRIAHLSEGRDWPSILPPGQFVTTGDPDALKPYHNQLIDFGLTQIKSL